MTELDARTLRLYSGPYLAAMLATVAAVLPGSRNPDRDRLLRTADLLHGPSKDANAALSECLAGVANAIGPGRMHEHRPETYLLVACARLLQAPLVGQADGPAVSVPEAGDLRTWLDELGAACLDWPAEDQGDEGLSKRVQRAIALQSLRMWLMQCLNLRVDGGAKLPEVQALPDGWRRPRAKAKAIGPPRWG